MRRIHRTETINMIFWQSWKRRVGRTNSSWRRTAIDGLYYRLSTTIFIFFLPTTLDIDINPYFPDGTWCQSRWSGLFLPPAFLFAAYLKMQGIINVHNVRKSVFEVVCNLSDLNSIKSQLLSYIADLFYSLTVKANAVQH